MDIVKVTWRDARLYPGEHTDLEHLRAPVYETVGFEHPPDKDGSIVLACERDDEGGWRQITIIPAGMVLNREVILADA
jgi:hypothetical protein